MIEYKGGYILRKAVLEPIIIVIAIFLTLLITDRTFNFEYNLFKGDFNLLFF